MNDTAKSVITILSLLVGLPVLILWARDRVSSARWRRRNSPEKIASERRAYETLSGVEIHSSRVGEATVRNDDHRSEAGKENVWRLGDLSE